MSLDPAFRVALGLWDAVIAPDFSEIVETANTSGEMPSVSIR